MKIDEVQNQLTELKNRVDDSLEQMEEALPLAQRTEEAHQNIMDWVAIMEPALRAKETSGAQEEDLQVFIIYHLYKPSKDVG